MTQSTYGNKKTVTEFTEIFVAYVNKTSSSVPLTIQKVQLSVCCVLLCTEAHSGDEVFTSLTKTLSTKGNIQESVLGLIQ